jgi:hypothetical protein
MGELWFHPHGLSGIVCDDHVSPVQLLLTHLPL